jgi:hypothetical protein
LAKKSIFVVYTQTTPPPPPLFRIDGRGVGDMLGFTAILWPGPHPNPSSPQNKKID